MFGKWAEKYFAEVSLAESTRAIRKSVYDRNLATEFGRLKLEVITPSRLMARCEKNKERGSAAPAEQARDIVLQVYHASGLEADTPAEAIRLSAIARISSFRVGRQPIKSRDHFFVRSLSLDSSIHLCAIVPGEDSNKYHK